ncbi:MAG: UTP--glucose-1-phosphate uridylyltransferase, partial [Phycisphaerae bacterium]|nr:UTP--glucose-1-phosphate uridylyltransferase [Phycisphaerae bacterium]
PEYGVSRGCLLPRHEILGPEQVSDRVRKELASSLILVHGGMAQDVGPILEMVTEKYLLRAGSEWKARQAMRGIFDGITDSLADGDIRRLAEYTTENWNGPLKTIIPWVTNRFTETIIHRARAMLGPQFWGFLMLGGMSGGGMGLFVDPARRASFHDELTELMRQTKHELDDALPFAIEPVVYDFRINDRGSVAELKSGTAAHMPARYYAIQVPALSRLPRESVPLLRRADLDNFTSRGEDAAELLRVLRVMVNHMFPAPGAIIDAEASGAREEVAQIKRDNGFDAVQHEQIREDLKRGRIGLSRNRLPADTEIRDIEPGDVIDVQAGCPNDAVRTGTEALRNGEAAVVSLAAGVGSRWTRGAGVVKAANPFVSLDGAHRSFMEIHLAKSRLTSGRFGVDLPHVFTTSFLTHGPIAKHLRLNDNHGYAGPLFLSPGRSIGMRLVPMVRDLRFLWEELPQETLDEYKQKVRANIRAALIAWARERGEASDYTENVPQQCFHPPGHWYEIPNLLRNGVLARLLTERPRLQYLLVHNIDTLGADLDAGLLGLHIRAGDTLTFEVIPRRMGDLGGGLARVNGRVRLLEGLAQPRESDEFGLRYYNSMTTWVHIDKLLALFGLTREHLREPEEMIAERVRTVAARLPTYVTIKEVKRRWGHGQEDVFPVSQTEKLWGDMTSLPDVACGYVVVPRLRGQQLKDVAQLDPWANDGSLEHVRNLCRFA